MPLQSKSIGDLRESRGFKKRQMTSGRKNECPEDYESCSTPPDGRVAP